MIPKFGSESRIFYECHESGYFTLKGHMSKDEAERQEIEYFQIAEAKENCPHLLVHQDMFSGIGMKIDPTDVMVRNDAWGSIYHVRWTNAHKWIWRPCRSLSSIIKSIDLGDLRRFLSNMFRSYATEKLIDIMVVRYHNYGKWMFTCKNPEQDYTPLIPDETGMLHMSSGKKVKCDTEKQLYRLAFGHTTEKPQILKYVVDDWEKIRRFTLVLSGIDVPKYKEFEPLLERRFSEWGMGVECKIWDHTNLLINVVDAKMHRCLMWYH